MTGVSERRKQKPKIEKQHASTGPIKTAIWKRNFHLCEVSDLYLKITFIYNI